MDMVSHLFTNAEHISEKLSALGPCLVNYELVCNSFIDVFMKYGGRPPPTFRQELSASLAESNHKMEHGRQVKRLDIDVVLQKVRRQDKRPD